MSVDEKTITSIKQAKTLTVKRYKNFDRILFLHSSGKFTANLKVRGHVEDYPDIQQAINESMERLYGESNQD